MYKYQEILRSIKIYFMDTILLLCKIIDKKINYLYIL